MSYVSAFLNVLGVPETGASKYSISCFSCRESAGRSGYLNADSGFYKCWQPSCEYSESRLGATHVSKILREVFKYDYETLKTLEVLSPAKKAKVTPIFSKLLLPDCYVPILEGTGKIANAARSYLLSRNYDLEYIAEKYKVGFTFEKEGRIPAGYILIPFYDARFDLVYYQLRAIPDVTPADALRWINPLESELHVKKSDVLFNEIALYKNTNVLLHEGATDCMTTDGVAGLGVSLSETVVKKIAVSPVKRVYVMLDEGAWADTLNHAKTLLQATDKEVYAVPFYAGEKDPNKMGYEKTQEIIATRAYKIQTLTDYESLKHNIETVGTKTYPRKLSRVW